MGRYCLMRRHSTWQVNLIPGINGIFTLTKLESGKSFKSYIFLLFLVFLTTICWWSWHIKRIFVSTELNKKMIKVPPTFTLKTLFEVCYLQNICSRKSKNWLCTAAILVFKLRKSNSILVCNNCFLWYSLTKDTTTIFQKLKTYFLFILYILLATFLDSLFLSLKLCGRVF